MFRFKKPGLGNIPGKIFGTLWPAQLRAVVKIPNRKDVRNQPGLPRAQ
jgi:hypothetical protein